MEIEISLASNTKFIQFVVVEWIYGIHNPNKYGVLFANVNNCGRLNQREMVTSVESMDVIDRVVGYFEFRGSWFFLDQYMKYFLRGDLIICGLAS